jgi:hypothetical protein
VKVPAGTSWVRIHDATKAPLWFGPAPGASPSNRFDAPAAEYRVCYIGATIEGAFAETFLRNVPVTLLSLDDLAKRAASPVVTLREVTLVQFHGAGLAKLGATAAVAHGPYSVSRQWALSCWQHPRSPDGLIYRARHDDDQLAIALFDRADDSIDTPTPPILVSARPELPALLSRYGIGLV